MKSFYLISLIVLTSVSLKAQIFLNRNDLLQEKDIHSAVPVAIADMNGDGLDDIVTLHNGRRLFVQYQTPDPKRPFIRYEASRNLDNAEQNDIIVADFNNDGAHDIFTVGSYDRVKVLYAIPRTYEFELVYINVDPFFSQGASAGDFNGDGWMDVVMLNDNGLNYSMINDGAGNLVHVEFFDFVTTPPSDNSGNYGSVYTDFDMDGDNDFYIAKCRQGVGNPADPRRINALFVNDGSNNYTQDAASYGLASGRQTWTADFGDIDNDGDLDCFMTQHDVISEIYENIDNDTFINITAQSGLEIGGIPLQGMIRDLDNDGFQDILVSGDRLDYYRNNGDKTFTRVDAFGSVVFGTFSFGDLNHDGFTDVYASRVIPFNNPDPLREDILFLNQPNDYHFLALQLSEAADRGSAIGTAAILYGEWGVQIREVRAGEQYGVSNGHQLIFGLGSHTAYDSLVIRWPDGTRERFDGLAIDTHWKLIRGGCSIQSEQLWQPIEALCGIDSVVLRVDQSLEGVEWSTGETGDSIVIHEPGIYYATYETAECVQWIYPIEIVKDPDTVKPVITYIGQPVLCHGEEAELSVSFGQGYIWSTGESSQTIAATETGDYYAEVEGFCLSQLSDTVHIEFFQPEQPVTYPDTFHLGEQAILVAEGDSIIWYDESGTEILGYGDTLILDDLTATTIVTARNIGAIEGEDYEVGPPEQEGNSKYNGFSINGGLVFEVYKDLILESLTVFTDSIGLREIVITGNNFNYQQFVDLQPGETKIELNIELSAGTYEISTNPLVNNQTFGTASPWLWRSNEGILYPYVASDVIAITNSTFGEDFYYYFYDWQVSIQDQYCESALAIEEAYLDPGVGIFDPKVLSLLVAPNPTDGLSYVFIESASKGNLEIIAPDGRLIKSMVIDGSDSVYEINLDPFAPGMYTIRMIVGENVFLQKLNRL